MPNWAFGTVKVTGTREGVKSFDHSLCDGRFDHLKDS